MRVDLKRLRSSVLRLSARGYVRVVVERTNARVKRGLKTNGKAKVCASVGAHPTKCRERAYVLAEQTRHLSRTWQTVCQR